MLSPNFCDPLLYIPPHSSICPIASKIIVLVKKCLASSSFRDKTIFFNQFEFEIDQQALSFGSKHQYPALPCSPATARSDLSYLRALVPCPVSRLGLKLTPNTSLSFEVQQQQKMKYVNSLSCYMNAVYTLYTENIIQQKTLPFSLPVVDNY